MADTPASSGPPSRSSTPANNSSRFTAQNQTAEDVLKEQTVGLVHLSDFRKRRAEALEQLSRDVTPGTRDSGASTPDRREPSTNSPVAFKKRKKAVKKGGLSFGDEGEEDEADDIRKATSKQAGDDSESGPDSIILKQKRSLKPNASIAVQPKALTKSALLRDAKLKESLRKEYLQIQEAVRATEICLPFVFFDGKDAPGGLCRMKKGDQIWLFLDRARKVGATAASGSRKDWARIGVDDLMLVKGDLIVPHHYDFHHFILNHTTGYGETPLFPFSSGPTAATPTELLPQQAPDADGSPDATFSGNATSHLTTAADRAAAKVTAATALPADSDLEGFNSDPSFTKVVDRRWYEKNKHIYPASLWEEFDANKDYSTSSRKDGLGNAFFFSQ